MQNFFYSFCTPFVYLFIYFFVQLGDEISGKNADTIIRDRKTGKKRDLSKEQEVKDEEDKKNKEYLQKYEKWGKGYVYTFNRHNCKF